MFDEMYPENMTDSKLRQEEENCHWDVERDPEFEGCPRVWDGLRCWEPSPPGHLAIQHCFAELLGVKYDATQNATKWCHVNGTWANYSNYTTCMELPHEGPTHEGLEVSTMIYFVGYTISLVALLLAVWIFIYFKDLRCLRNTIHTNLMCTYILADFLWILNYTLQMAIQTDMVTCVILIVLLHYFHLTNFFWMFVEGLYLYMLVVETFTRENIKLRAYLIIGWASPLVIVLIWAIVRSLSASDQKGGSSLTQLKYLKIPRTDYLKSSTRGCVPCLYFRFLKTAVDLQYPKRRKTYDDNLFSNCPWMSAHTSDWIYQAPAIVVLAVNLIFLVRIMWVLITKLRSANNVETQQYRKATKALLVLIPLLGITYILFIVGPKHPGNLYGNVYIYLRAFLLATQGFTVALFYCFLNTEVQNTMRHHVERWKESRNIGSGGRRYTYSKDWSPNTRTESIRLYSKHEVGGAHYKKRESTASETTTMTLVGGGGGGSNRVSNGSMGPMLAVRAPVSPYLEAPMENAV